MVSSGSRTGVAVIGLTVVGLLAAIILYHHKARAIRSITRSDSEAENTQSNPSYALPREIARLKSRAVKESSGLVASRANPGLYWTHNDSRDGPYLYAFDASGAARGVWRVTNANARDWEALAAGPGPDSTKTYLYIGDIGDNGGRRTEVVVYRIAEPAINAGNTQLEKRKASATETAGAFRLRYPDGSHNAEALLVHPTTGNIYIVTKEVSGTSHVFRAATPLASTDAVTLKEVASLSIPGMVGGVITDGSISPDGKRVVLCDYKSGYELVLSPASADFDSIWQQSLVPVSLGSRKKGEAVTYRLDGRAILATSEGTPMPLFEIVRN